MTLQIKLTPTSTGGRETSCEQTLEGESTTNGRTSKPRLKMVRKLQLSLDENAATRKFYPAFTVI